MPEHEAATPDTYAVSLSAHPDRNGNVRELLSVEVTEYEAHSDEGIVPFVQRKLSNKYLPDHYILLLQVNKTGAINTEEAFREFTKQRLRLGEIWMLGHLDNESREQFLVICLYPKKAAASFQWEEEIAKNKSQADMLRMSRGTGKDFTEGKIEFKLPELE